MGRLGPGLLAILLIPAVAAIEDPAGDVSATLGGAPVDVPYVDIRNVTGLIQNDVLEVRMQFEAPWSVAPSGVEINAIFIVDLDGTGDANVYQTHDITVLCTKNVGSGAFGCRDTNQDPDTAHAVIGAGIEGNNVTARIQLKQPDDAVAVAGGSSRVEDGNVTAQDFTGNALPYNNRPAETTSVTLNPEGADSGGSPWLWIVLATAALIVLPFALRGRILGLLRSEKR